MKTGIYRNGKITLYLTLENGVLRRCSFREPISNVELGKQLDLESDSLFCDIKNELDEYFRLERRTFSVPLLVRGTPFQKSVWNEISKVKYGRTISYLQLAENIGNVKAIRAVAQACGANPVSIFIPCHRIINSSGALGGYNGGIMNKKVLLELENSHNNLFDFNIY